MIQPCFPLPASGMRAAFPMVQPRIVVEVPKVALRFIQETVADHYGLDPSCMVSQRRAREVARPRQIAMYLARDLTPLSLPNIGRMFGGRDHTTVMHAIKAVEHLQGADEDIREDIEALRERLAA